ncbi:MAG: glycosyltransferase [bacterium]
MKKLLAISCSFPPLLFPRSIQIHRTISRLYDFGWRTTILTADPDTLFGSRDNSLEGLYPQTYERLSLSAAPVKSRWYLHTRRLFPSFGRIPDIYIGWAVRAIRFIKKHLEHSEFDAMCTFGTPMSDHLVGLCVKRRRDLPWVAHFSDPWVDNPYAPSDRLSDAVNRYFENRVFTHADAAIFVTEYTRQLVMSKYPEPWKNRTTVIPHSFDPNLYPISRPANEKLTFRYLGSFYSSLRTPETIFQAINRLKKETPEIASQCLFEFVGSSNPVTENLCQTYQTGPEVNFRSKVSYLESLRLMKEADVLVLIDAAAEVNIFLPSKLIDYLGADRPILGITPSVGASADVVRQVGGPVVSPQSPEEVAAAIKTLYRQHTQGKLGESSMRPELLENYTAERTTRQFAEILEQISRKEPQGK